MSRFRSTNAKGQRLRYFGFDHYRMSWTVDYYYRDSNLRHPRVFTRDTDLAGAKRFAKRWKLALPGSNVAGPGPAEQRAKQDDKADPLQRPAKGNA